MKGIRARNPDWGDWGARGSVGSKHRDGGVEVEGTDPGRPHMSPKLRDCSFGSKPGHMAEAPGSSSSPPSLPKSGQSIDTGQMPSCFETNSA